ncbi:FKBP-type peptidyl-prolyl cis-trans isomerase [Salinimonas chungwhensis]|uniref:FKBP-type peptidyl-prolyl cis-trans isomerase n=1 Tax=Salinimonas chungwhensis TaxID=265425 RepID=UPI000362D40D|nr:FKBP-type peptidyl-prolyl cis-trans isomerase [Salinimonas chungwhensis]
MAKNKRKQAKGSAGQNRNTTAAFIERYLTQDDVRITNSGLMYRIIENAEGAHPSADDVVKVHQRILLADGSVIDDTYKKGPPENFALNEAIEGLQEGLMLMPIGARYEFVIPPELAWGKKGNGEKIGPHAVMVVDVRLIDTDTA